MPRTPKAPPTRLPPLSRDAFGLRLGLELDGMNQPPPHVQGQKARLRETLALLFGCFLGLALLKFGNPPILEKLVTAPNNLLELIIFSPWPIVWAYGLLAVVAVVGLFAARRPGSAPAWVVLLPLAWLGWQVLAAARSIDSALSYPTVGHFAACCACFYLGYFCVHGPAVSGRFWIGLVAAFLIVLAVGFEQHFGGLAQTRHYFETEIKPKMAEVPPDLLKKMSSDRIFSTLFYPNALAGAILLLLPPVLALVAGARERLTAGARAFLLIVVGGAAVACLVWSGSKGGWLLLLFLGFIGLLRMSFSRRLKILLVCVVLAGGLGGFGLRYAGFFKKGATSVAARFDYWHAAFRTAISHPILGTGPGTFARPYAQLKRPESEMARLVHNDYLEQASDSGWFGALAWTGFMVAALACAYPRRLASSTEEPAAGAMRLSFAAWLGILGWALQSLFEFGLYMPSLAWPALAILGWLLARAVHGFSQATLCPAGASLGAVPPPAAGHS